MLDWTTGDAYRANLIFASYWELSQLPVSLLAKELDFPKSNQVLGRLLSGEQYWEPEILARPVNARARGVASPDSLWRFIQFRPGPPRRQLTSFDWLHYAAGTFVHPRERELDLLTNVHSHLELEVPKVLEYAVDLPWEFLPEAAIDLVAQSWAEKLARIAYQFRAAEIGEILASVAKRIKHHRSLWDGPWPVHELWISNAALERAVNLEWPYDRCNKEMIDELFCDLIYTEVAHRGLNPRVYSAWSPTLRNRLYLPDSSKYYLVEIYERIKLHNAWCFNQLRGTAVANWFPFNAPFRVRMRRRFLQSFHALKPRLLHTIETDSTQEFLRRYLRHDPARAFIDIQREHITKLTRSGRTPRDRAIRSYSGARLD